MKRCLLILVLLLPAGVSRASWTKFSIGRIQDADFLTAQSGLIVAQDTTWRFDHGDVRTISSPRHPRQIAIQDSDVAWLATDSALYRGTRGWTSWKAVWDSIPPTLIGVVGTSALFQCFSQVFLATRDTIVETQGLPNAQYSLIESISPKIALLVGGLGVYRTTNAGATWLLLNSIGGAVPSGLYADRAHGMFYMSGPLRVSTDAGSTWKAIPTPRQFSFDFLNGAIVGAHDCSGAFYMIPNRRADDFVRGTPEPLFFDLGPAPAEMYNIYKTWVFNGGADVTVLASSTSYFDLELYSSGDGINGSLSDSVSQYVSARIDTLRVNYCSHPTDSLRLVLHSSTCLPIPVDSVQVLAAPSGTLKRMPVSKVLSGDSIVVTSLYTAKRSGFDSVKLMVWLRASAPALYREGLPVKVYVLSAGGPAQLTVPTTLDFGHVRPDTLLAKQLTIRNTGCDDLRIDSIVSTNPSLFALTLPTLPRYLSGADSLRIAVSYHPRDVGDDLESIEIGTDAGHRFISVTGTVARLDVNSEAATTYTVAPNPATEWLTIDIPSPARYSLIDALGIAHGAGELRAGSNAISLATLRSGVYVLQVEGQVARRLLIRK